MLNTLLLTDITLWKNEYLEQLIDMTAHFAGESFTENRLAQCSSPLMIISLSVELLEVIGNSRTQFRQPCSEARDELLGLGTEICNAIGEIDVFKEILYDKDFQNRSLIKIITQCRFAELLSHEDPKS